MVFMKLVHGQIGFVEHVAMKIVNVDHTIAKIVELEILWVVGHVVVIFVAPIDNP